MIIGTRLRDLREAKRLSQGEIEKRSGLLRCYISRVENGHTVPSIETLEKMTRALEVPMYELFYDGVEPPKVSSTINMSNRRQKADWASRGKGLRTFSTIVKAMGQMSERDRRLLVHLARKMSHRHNTGREN